MENFLVYGTETCPYCVMAKRLLQEKGFAYTEIRVDLDDAEREKMMNLSGRRTVPQIFLGDKHIGGYDDLCEYFKTNNGA